jgi:hypothetical protein
MATASDILLWPQIVSCGSWWGWQILHFNKKISVQIWLKLSHVLVLDAVMMRPYTWLKITPYSLKLSHEKIWTNMTKIISCVVLDAVIMQPYTWLKITLQLQCDAVAVGTASDILLRPQIVSCGSWWGWQIINFKKKIFEQIWLKSSHMYWFLMQLWCGRTRDWKSHCNCSAMRWLPHQVYYCGLNCGYKVQFKTMHVNSCFNHLR